MASGKTWRLAIAGGAALLLVAIPAQAQSVLNRGGGAEPEFLDLLLTGSPGNYAGYRNPESMPRWPRRSANPMRSGAPPCCKKRKASPWPTCPGCLSVSCRKVGPRVGGYIQNQRDFNRSRWLWIKVSAGLYSGR